MTTSPDAPGSTWTAKAHQTKTMVAVEALRERIMRGEIKPGERLTLAHLSTKLGMSPTPIREAIRVLQAEGLLSHTPHYGVSVANFSIADAQEVYMLRLVLEPLAARLAATRLDAQALAQLRAFEAAMEEAYAQADADRLTQANATWHMCIYEGARSKQLLEIIQQLWGKFPWEVIWVVPTMREHSLEQHRAIMAALEARDEDAAERLMRAHIASSQQSVVEHLQQQLGEAHQE